MIFGGMLLVEKQPFLEKNCFSAKFVSETGVSVRVNFPEHMRDLWETLSSGRRYGFALAANMSPGDSWGLLDRLGEGTPAARFSPHHPVYLRSDIEEALRPDWQILGEEQQPELPGI